MFPLLVTVLVIFISSPTEAAIQENVSKCPLWTKWQNSSHTCECGTDLRGIIVDCDSTYGATKLKSCYCMTTAGRGDSHEDITPLVGSCWYTCLSTDTQYNEFYTDIILSTTINITDSICGPYNRTGVMCGECIENYSLPIYSYDIACVECKDYKYNWMKYFAIVYLPLTVFYFVVIMFRLSVTTGAMNSYVLVSQLVTSPQLALVLSNSRHLSNGLKYFITLSSIWNLDFFRSLYNPFCLHPKLSALQIFTLDYFTALYPMVLIMLTYGFVKLHDRSRVLVSVCRPAYKCLHIFRKEWNIKTSLVEAFATFYLLSYVKVLNVSGSILTPTLFFSMDNNSTTFFYYNGSIPYFGDEHRPYAIIATLFLLLFNISPMLILFLYPCSCFHKCLNKAGCRCHTLHVFMDAILGSYSHRPRERRYFGGYYLLIRVINVAGITIFNTILYISFSCYCLTITVVLVAFFRPNKNNWHNVVDIILLLILLNQSLTTSFYFESLFTSPLSLDAFKFPVLVLYFHSYLITVSLLFLYAAGVLLSNVLPLQLIKRPLYWVYRLSCYRCINKDHSQLEETLPYRLEHSERKLLLHE